MFAPLTRLFSRGGTNDHPGGVFEVYLPSERGNMTVRVNALGPDDALHAVLQWFTSDPEGPQDEVSERGRVSVKPSDLPAFWSTDHYREKYGVER